MQAGYDKEKNNNFNATSFQHMLISNVCDFIVSGLCVLAGSGPEPYRKRV